MHKSKNIAAHRITHTNAQKLDTQKPDIYPCKINVQQGQNLLLEACIKVHLKK